MPGSESFQLAERRECVRAFDVFPFGSAAIISPPRLP
jgi:hypothetical protein